MFCSNCGTAYDDNAAFCPNCGAANPAAAQPAAPVQPDPYAQQVPPVQPDPYAQPYGAPVAPYGAPVVKQSNGMAIAALICGIVGLLSSWCIGVVPSIRGVVFGILGLKKSTEMGGEGKGMAIAGLVCGGIGLLASIIYWLLVGWIGMAPFMLEDW